MSKMMNDGLFSSDRIDWETPPDFFDLMNREFHFTLDVCAFEHNKKVKKCFTPDDDGLSKKWSGVCWMNPPYGREITAWVKKAYDESRGGRYSSLPSPCASRFQVVARVLYESL